MSTTSPIPSWMAHDAFQRLPPGPKRYLWNRKMRQDIADGRAPVRGTLRSFLEDLPSRAWFVRSTDARPQVRREAFEPGGAKGIWSSWTYHEVGRQVGHLAAQKQADTTSLTILRDFVDKVLGPVADHKMAKKKLRRVLPLVHPDNLNRLLRPDDELSKPGLEEASARSRALFRGLTLFPTPEQNASVEYNRRKQQWAEAKCYEGSLSGMDRYLGRYLREAYTLYEALQVILNEPIYQELLFRVPEATEDAKLSLENVRLLVCFFWVLLLEKLREIWVDAPSPAVRRQQ